jgi:glutamate-1-semialdehyde 2,1-aminomutase
VMGKVMGGGLPAAALGGRADLMRMLAPAGKVYQAGTLSGNPVAVAAGLATLALLDDAAYLRLAALTEQLASGLREAAGGDGKSGYPIQIASAPGLLTVFFSDTPVHDLAAAESCDHEAYATWCRELLSRGVYAPASQFEAWFPSLAHTAEQLDLTMSAAAAAFAELT